MKRNGPSTCSSRKWRGRSCSMIRTVSLRRLPRWRASQVTVSPGPSTPDARPATTRSPVSTVESRWRSTLRERSKHRSGGAAITVSSSICARGSAARELHAVALRLEPGGRLLAVVALELDRAVLDRAARAAEPLEIGRDGLQLPGAKAAHDGDGLAAAAALLAEDAH